jgi:hypothetical protein
MTSQFLLEMCNTDKTLARGSMLRETPFKQNANERFDAKGNIIQGKLYNK